MSSISARPRLSFAVRAVALAALTLAAACSGGDAGKPTDDNGAPADPTAAAGEPSGAAGSATDLGAPDGGGSTTVDGLTVSTSPTLRVVQGRFSTVHLKVGRSGAIAAAKRPVRIDVTGLPSGVTASQLLVPGDATDADLTLTSTDATLQGVSAVTVTATVEASTVTASTSARLQVRGLPGTLDQSFGDHGVVDAFVESAVRGQAVHPQPDGKVIVVALCDVGAAKNQVCVTRVDAAGKPDATFAGGHRVTIPHGALAGDSLPTVFSALQKDGKLLVLPTDYAHLRATERFIRLNADGTPDLSLGPSGERAVGAIPGLTRLLGLRASPQGSLYLASAAGYAIEFRRLAADTSFDVNYGNAGAGRVLWDHGYLSDFGIRADGSVFGVGTEEPSTGDVRADVFFQLTPQGLLDAAFGTLGISRHVRLPTPTLMYQLHVAERPDGRLVAAASDTSGVRFVGVTRDGKGYDPSFAMGGVSPLYGPGAGFYWGVTATFVGQDDKLFTAGSFGGERQLMGYDASGVADPAFPDVGVQMFGFSAQDSDDRIVVTQAGAHATLTRYWQ